MQDKFFTMKVSEAFRKGLKRAARAANAPTVAEFVKGVLVKEAAKYGVKIKR